MAGVHCERRSRTIGASVFSCNDANFTNVWDRKLANAYDLADYADGKGSLTQIHRELMDVNPSAARSLEEGLEETLTIHRLGVPSELLRALRTTNPIESAFSRVRTVCRNVKRWRDG